MKPLYGGRAAPVPFRLRVATVLAITMAGLAPVTVVAHARPVRVVPGHGAVLATSPAVVEIETAEDMERSAGANDIVVTDASRAAVSSGPAAVDSANRRRLTVSLNRGLPTGDYTVSWKTLSAEDREGDQGTFTFRVDPAATPHAGREDLVLPRAIPSPGSDGDAGRLVLVVAATGVLAIVAGFAWFVFRPTRP